VVIIGLCTVLFSVVQTPALAESTAALSSADPFPFEVRSLNYVFPPAYQSVGDIDFRNGSIHLPDESKDVLLTNGHYESTSERGTETMSLQEVQYLTTPNSTGPQYVLLILQRNLGEKQQAIAQVVEFANHRLQLVQQIQKDSGGSHFAYKSNETSHMLVLHALTSEIAFQWSGRDFISPRIQ